MITILTLICIISLVIIIFYFRYLILSRIIPLRIKQAKKSHDHEKAIKLLSSVLSMERDNIDANWLITELYMKSGQNILAQMYLLDIIHASKYSKEITEVMVRETLAGIYLHSGNMHKALEQYYLLKSTGKLSLQGMKNAIKLSIDHFRFMEARKFLTRAYQSWPDDGELYFFDASIEYLKKNFVVAEEKIIKAIGLAYDPVEARILAGKIYFINEKFEKAITMIEGLPADMLDLSEMENILGQCFYFIKDYRSAILMLEKLIPRLKEKDNSIADALYILGCAHEASGHIDKAMETWRSITSEYPYYQNASQKTFFYSQIAVDQKMRDLILAPFQKFSELCEKLLLSLDLRIRQKVYEDDKSFEFLCVAEKDPHPVPYYYVNILRQTTSLSIDNLKNIQTEMNRLRAKYLMVISPFISDDAIRFAQKSGITLYDFSIFKEKKLV